MSELLSASTSSDPINIEKHSRYINPKTDFVFKHKVARDNYSHDESMRNVGRHELALEIASKLKAKGLTTPEITELTGLSQDEISILQSHFLLLMLSVSARLVFKAFFNLIIWNHGTSNPGSLILIPVREK